jgi:hypothetical protein
VSKTLKVFVSEKSCGEIFQVFDQSIVCLCPIHGKVKTVFISLGSIGKIAAISTV